MNLKLVLGAILFSFPVLAQQEETAARIPRPRPHFNFVVAEFGGDDKRVEYYYVLNEKNIGDGPQVNVELLRVEPDLQFPKYMTAQSFTVTKTMEKDVPVGRVLQPLSIKGRIPGENPFDVPTLNPEVHTEVEEVKPDGTILTTLCGDNKIRSPIKRVCFAIAYKKN